MLPNIFWSRTDYISGAYATKMVAISSPVHNYPCRAQPMIEVSLLLSVTLLGKALISHFFKG